MAKWIPKLLKQQLVHAKNQAQLSDCFPKTIYCSQLLKYTHRSKTQCGLMNTFYPQKQKTKREIRSFAHPCSMIFVIQISSTMGTREGKKGEKMGKQFGRNLFTAVTYNNKSNIKKCRQRCRNKYY